MSTDLTERPANGAALANVRGGGNISIYSQEQLELVKRTICVGATDDEFQLFMGVCQRTGLDPFTRQLHAVKRYDFKQKREVMAIQIGIDGFRLIAQRTGEVNGQDGPYWCGPDGVWKELWTGDGPPYAAKMNVYRKGSDRPFTGIAKYSQFVAKTKDGRPNHIWQTMPDHMIAKVAEAHALRKAFPMELSGLYEAAEMREDGEIGKASPSKPATAAKKVQTIGTSSYAAKWLDIFARGVKHFKLDADKILAAYEVEAFEQIPLDDAQGLVDKIKANPPEWSAESAPSDEFGEREPDHDDAGPIPPPSTPAPPAKAVPGAVRANPPQFADIEALRQRAGLSEKELFDHCQRTYATKTYKRDLTAAQADSLITWLQAQPVARQTGEEDDK